MRDNSHHRWTEVELKYSKIKGRLFDRIQTMKSLKTAPDEAKPMYSSFSVNKVFNAPPTSKDMLQR